MIEFRTDKKSELWLPFYPGLKKDNPQEFVAERNRHHGWQKYRFNTERKPA